MKKISFKLFLFILPGLVLIGLYVVCDPYLMLRPPKHFDQAVMRMPEGYVAWQTYLNNRDSVPYDAFILGNSCTMAFRVEEWQKHLKPTDRGLRFFENYESLGGVCQKLQALDSVGATVKHLLVVLDVNSLVRTIPHEGTPQLFDAQVAGLSPLGFQWKWIQEFIYPKNLIPYLYYLVRGHYTPFMKDVIRPDSLLLREPVTNNFINPRDANIRCEGTAYWTRRGTDFPPRTEAGMEEAPVIGSRQILLLQALNARCHKLGAQLTFILGPDYRQRPANAADVKWLRQLLGDDAVWDFTGVNVYTRDVRNYYERGHYRPELGARLLEEIYRQRAN